MTAHATIAANGQQVDRYGIGASEIAAAVGISSFRSPLSLWLEKTGRGEEFAGNEHTQWGQMLEPLLRAWYAEKTQLAVLVPPASVFHPTLTWARCTPDGIALGPDDKPLHLVQCKNVGRRQAWRWGEDVTDPNSITSEYLAQVNWEMFVTGYDRCDLIASIGGSPPVIYEIHRDAQFEAELVEAAAEFWQCVTSGKPPRVDHSEDWTKYLAQQMKRSGSVAPRSGKGDALAVQLRDAYEMVKRAEENCNQIKNEFRALLTEQGAEAVETGEGPIKWKKNVNGTPTFTVPRAWSKESR